MYLIYGGSAQVLWFVEAVGISPADDAGLSGSDSQRRQWRFFFACRWGGWFIAAGQSKPAVCSEVVLFQGPTSKSQVVDNKTHTSNQNFVIRFLQFKRALLMSLDQVGESQSRVEWSGGVRNGWAQEPQQKVEQLARKYEDKYKQMGDVASKLTLDQATFRDIQEKKMELYSAIAKMEQGETSDTALQDRAEKIQTDLDELCKL
ncbi:hypothetical protein HPP92_022719 [Vanilla planifolia]|uniref:Uncharacterized protein n=1 Tax=Vanilla planifolia TaxID=51239 RepID=A0A835PU27_VANPL|nr:hypothetical protein HPP92_022719 [Vanilla planifolia]